MNVLSTKQRTESLIDYCGSKSNYARRIGVNTASISQYVKRGTFNLRKLLDAFPEINREWLEFGVGKMLKREEGYEETEVVTDEVAEHQYATSKAPSTDMITIPRAVLDALTQQLDVKDAQIQHLMEQLSRISYGTDIQPIESR